MSQDGELLPFPRPPPPPSLLGWVMLGSAVGGLIDGSPGFGSLISGPAKRSSSATYQPYKHPPQTLCGGGQEGGEGVGGKRIRKERVARR